MTRSFSLIAAVLLLTCGLMAQKPSKSKTTTKQEQTPLPQKKYSLALETKEEKMSYAVGYDVALKIVSDIKKQGLEINTNAFIAGISDGFIGKEPSIDALELQEAMQMFQEQLKTKQDANQQKLAAMIEMHKSEGKNFLNENRKKDSVQVTASGLQYKILRPGTGASPVDTSLVSVHYRGRLINGTVFDESYGRGEPAEFRLNQVIKGWTEGLQLMKVGAKFEFYIPSELAYGDRPAGQLIPPGSTLIFEVELLKIQ